MIGGDPGATGAWAVVERCDGDGFRCVFWSAWRKRTALWRAVGDGSQAAFGRRAQAIDAALSDAMGRDSASNAAIELIRPFGARRGYTALAESAGGMVHAAESRGLSVVRVEPAKWRASVLGVRPGTTKPLCDEASYEYWGWSPPKTQLRARKWPNGPGRWDCPMPPSWAMEHVAAAACIAAGAIVAKNACTGAGG